MQPTSPFSQRFKQNKSRLSRSGQLVASAGNLLTTTVHQHIIGDWKSGGNFAAGLMLIISGGIRAFSVEIPVFSH
jgi:hypothetical protein